MARPWSLISAGGSLSLVHADSTVTLTRKDGSKVQLHELCKAILPPCHLNPALFNGHLQTAWTVVDTGGPSIYYRRRTFAAEDPAFEGHFAVDFVVCPPQLLGTPTPIDDKGPDFDDLVELMEDPVGVGHTYLPDRTTYLSNEKFQDLSSRDDKPLLIVLHGLSGGSYEAYIRYALAPLVITTGNKKGLSGGEWEALVVNSRGCAGAKTTSKLLYHARSTWDIRQVVKWARQTWPNRPIFAMGFSIGANILTNYVAEEGSDCLLKAAIIVANPYNLETCHKALERSRVGMEVYSKTMGAAMRGVFEAHKDQLLVNGDIDLERIRNGKYLYEFDRDLQCPLWGYPTHSAYYRDASSADSVLAVRVPFLAVHAEDDPIATVEALPIAEFEHNPFTTLCTTPNGGHIGWFEMEGGRWYPKLTTAFLNKMWQDVECVDMGTEERKGATVTKDTTSKKVFQFDPARTKARAGAVTSPM